MVGALRDGQELHFVMVETRAVDMDVVREQESIICQLLHTVMQTRVHERGCVRTAQHPMLLSESNLLLGLVEWH